MVLQTLYFNHFNPRSYEYFSMCQNNIAIKRSLLFISACMPRGDVKVTRFKRSGHSPSIYLTGNYDYPEFY